MGSVGVLKAKKKIRILGQTAAKRLYTMPDVPTMKEGGVDLVGGVTRMVLLPKGVPANVLKIHRAALKKAMADPGYIKSAKKRKVPYTYIPGDKLLKQVAEESKMWDAMWKKNPWKVKKRKKKKKKKN